MTRNRDIAAFLGLTEAANTTNAVLTSTADGTGVTVFTTIDSLPTSGNSAGDLAFVDSDDRLYIFGGGGWYTLSLVNATPSITSILDANSGTSPFSLSTDGATTILTVTATDSDGLPLTFASSADADFNNLATISQDSSVFTITPRSEDSATTESGTVTFTATDGIATATSAAQTFTLVYAAQAVTNSADSVLLVKATGNGTANQNFTDKSSSAASATVNGASVVAPLNSTFTPFRAGGYYAQFDGSGDRLYWTPDTDINFGTGAFTVECWFWIDSGHDGEETMFEMNTSNYGDAFLINIRNSYGVTAYLNTGSVGSALTGHDPATMGSISALESTGWTHLAIVRSSDTITLYLNGKSYDSGSYSGQDFTNQSEAMIGGANNGNFHGRIFDFRIVKGTAVYTAEFTPPTEFLTDVSGTALLTCRRGWFYDESSNSRNVVTAGNPQALAAHVYDHIPYVATTHGASVRFDGTTGRSLSYPDSTDYELNGSGTAWAVEFWVYNSNWASPTEQSLFEKFGGATTGWTIYSYGQNRLDWYNGATSNSITTSPIVSDTGWLNNVWHHCVFTKNSSNNFGIFVNGHRIRYEASFSNPAGAAGGTLDVGARNATTKNPVTGFMSDIRIVKGSTPYDPTSSTLTVPTAPLTAITNTKFLIGTENDAGVFDNIQTKALELGGDAASSTTQAKNATSSIAFDGTGDYVKTSVSQEELGTDDFTIEFWAYQTATASYAQIFAQGYGTTGIGSHFRNTGDITVSRPGTAVDHTFASGVDTANTWYHVALTRGAGNIRCFVNGTQTGSAANTRDYQAGTLYLGVDGNGTSSPYTGYIEDFRITKGLVRYPFIPSATTLSADSNTFLLCMHADAATTVGGSNWTVGNGGTGPTVSNFAPGSGMKSYYFSDGSTYKMTFDHTGTAADYEMGDATVGAADNFSIELWIWLDEDALTSNAMTFLSTYGDASNAQSFRMLFRTDGNFRIARTVSSGGDDTTSSTFMSTRKWHHFYYVEEADGSTMYWAFYCDGSLVDSGSSTSGVFDFQEITVGARADNSQSFHGYISNLRIQRGTVAITGQAQAPSFTAPTAEFTG